MLVLDRCFQRRPNRTQIPLSLTRLANVCAESPLPVVAIGGINASNIQLIRGVNPWGIAMSSALMNAQTLVTFVHPENGRLGMYQSVGRVTRVSQSENRSQTHKIQVISQSICDHSVPLGYRPRCRRPTGRPRDVRGDDFVYECLVDGVIHP